MTTKSSKTSGVAKGANGKTKGTKFVLSIDGGGIKGIIPAMVLAYLEGRIGKRIAECFDLIVGTSTGGIIALALSCPKPPKGVHHSAADVVKLYKDRGREIFDRSLLRKIRSPLGITEELYSDDGLTEVLCDCLGNQTLGDVATRNQTCVMVTTYDIVKRCPLLLNSWKHGGTLMRDAAHATSAAPTYFEPAQILVNGKERTLIDGGVFINSPAVSAYTTALDRLGGDIFVLSLGTGRFTREYSHEAAKGWGKSGWVNQFVRGKYLLPECESPLLGCIFDGVADVAHQQMEQLNRGSYVHLQPKLNRASDDLDKVTKRNICDLEQQAHELINAKQGEITALVNKICQHKGIPLPQSPAPAP